MKTKTKTTDLVKEIFGWVRDISIAIIIAVCIKEFVFAHTVVPTGSMLPTIQINDHILVDKLTYRFELPERGDIVVFHQNSDNVFFDENKDLIKRVIGLPGDTIDLRDGAVYINDKPLEEEYISEPMNCSIKGTLQYPFIVPEHMYFVMGDNRNKSLDSRYIGPINEEKIFAKAGLRIWPINSFGLLR